MIKAQKRLFDLITKDFGTEVGVRDSIIDKVEKNIELEQNLTYGEVEF